MPDPVVALRPHPLQDHVHGDAMQPGGEGGVASEQVELLPGADEDVLGQLVRLVSPGHAADQAVDAREVRAVEALVRLDVTRRGARGVGTIAFERGRRSACLQRRSLTCNY